MLTIKINVKLSFKNNPLNTLWPSQRTGAVTFEDLLTNSTPKNKNKHKFHFKVLLIKY